MLVLSRKAGEKLMIGDDIEILIQRVAGGRVSLAIAAPRDIRILRGELTPFEDRKPAAKPSQPTLANSLEPLRDVPLTL